MPPLLLLSPLQHQPLNLPRRLSSPLLPQPPSQEKDKEDWSSLQEDYTSQPLGRSTSAAWSQLWCVSSWKQTKKNDSYDYTKGKGHYRHKERRPTPVVVLSVTST
ncbi:hypothetical protein ACLOJK_004409 [Asimina triloba]